ncbi:putative transcription factor MADS-type1 family [Helianthus annuus]|nr:putative transcription factor MADS-type1 family [Helianthus annuus]
MYLCCSPNNMTRSMVMYQFIEDERVRNVTMRKRKASLMKKMSELKILCDVDACLVMYETDDSPPDVWPSPSEAHRVIQRFNKSPMWSPNALQDHSAYLEKQIAKMKKQLAKEKEKNMKHLMVKCLFDENALSEVNNQEVLDGVRSAIDSEIEAIDDMIKEAQEKAKKKMVFRTFF